MTRSSDSGDGHQVLHKNGKDQSQDKAIRDLHHDLRTHIADETLDLHKTRDAILSLGSKIEKYVFAGRIAWGFIAILGTIVMVYQTSISSDIRDIEKRVTALETRQHAFEERGTKWGEHLDESVKDIRNDIREIRRTLNGRSKGQ